MKMRQQHANYITDNFLTMQANYNVILTLFIVEMVTLNMGNIIQCAVIQIVLLNTCLPCRIVWYICNMLYVVICKKLVSFY